MAWIKTYSVGSGVRYRVFWKDPSGKQHAKVYRRLSDARTHKRPLEHALDTGDVHRPP